MRISHLSQGFMVMCWGGGPDEGEGVFLFFTLFAFGNGLVFVVEVVVGRFVVAAGFDGCWLLAFCQAQT